MRLVRLALASLLLLVAPLAAHAAEVKPLVNKSGIVQPIPSTDTLKLPSATTANASVNIPHGTAPTSPNDGDCWTTTAGLYCRINGSTAGPFGTGGGTPGGSSGQIQYNNAGAFGGFTASGDFTINTATGVGTLANSGATAGTYGSATQIPIVTVDAKGRITSITTTTPTGGGGSGDTYFNNVSLLAGFNGSDGATSASDESGFARTLTFNGNAQLDNGIAPQFGSAALLLDGTGDYVSAASSSTLTVSGSLDTTIEAWVYPTSVAHQGTIANKRPSSSASEFSFAIDTSQKLIFTGFSGGSSVVTLTSTNNVPLNTWTHVAATRQIGVWRIFIGGTLEATVEESAPPAANTSLFLIGRDGFSTARDFTGSIDEFRFTRGAARYITSFTPSATEFPRN